MDIKASLAGIGLDTENAVVIGSGIMDALGIRKSNDIDVVVEGTTYARLEQNNQFHETENHGKKILADDVFEIGTSWGVLAKDQGFDDLYGQSVVIEGVRYITPQFLLAVKKSWLQDDDVRQKDIDDVKLMADYLAKKTP